MSKESLVVALRSVAMARPIEAQGHAAPPFADPVGILQMPDQRTATAKLQSFFESTSSNMTLSEDRSATSRFSLAFSSSSVPLRRGPPCLRGDVGRGQTCPSSDNLRQIVFM